MEMKLTPQQVANYNTLIANCIKHLTKLHSFGNKHSNIEQLVDNLDIEQLDEMIEELGLSKITD